MAGKNNFAILSFYWQLLRPDIGMWWRSLFPTGVSELIEQTVPKYLTKIRSTLENVKKSIVPLSKQSLIVDTSFDQKNWA